MSAVAIDQLSRAEKISLMETLWHDLSADKTVLPSPAWHDEALKDAKAALNQGKANLLDWAEAKETLRQRARE